jgi:hypothetical protein
VCKSLLLQCIFTNKKNPPRPAACPRPPAGVVLGGCPGTYSASISLRWQVRRPAPPAIRPCRPTCPATGLPHAALLGSQGLLAAPDVAARSRSPCFRRSSARRHSRPTPRACRVSQSVVAQTVLIPCSCAACRAPHPPVLPTRHGCMDEQRQHQVI